MMIGDFKLQGFNIKVTSIIRLPADDLSGQTSSTNIAENGIKPKRLSVALQIRFVDDFLQKLVAIVEATDDADKRIIYDIVDRTANALNIKQARFAESMMVREDETTKSWSITFVLIEYRSVPEIKASKRAIGAIDQREDTTPLSVQEKLNLPNKNDIYQQKSKKTELSMFEKILSKIDDALEPEYSTEDDEDVNLDAE